MKLNQVILGDAIANMRQLPDASIDALISDPPYGTTALQWDKQIDWATFWGEAKRVCKPNATIALFAQQPFATTLIMSNRKDFRYEIVWEKPLAMGFMDSKIRPLRCHELILIFCEKFRGKTPGTRATYNPQKTPGKPYKAKQRGACQHYRLHKTNNTDNHGDRFPRDVLKFNNVTRSWDKTAFHPTQKPIDLLTWLVLTYTNPGNVVLDPFSGSGTTAVACLERGRYFIGVEKDPHYHALSLQRIERARESQDVVAS